MTLDFSMWIFFPLTLAIIAILLQESKAAFALLALFFIGALFEQKLKILGLVSILIGFSLAYKANSFRPFWRYVSYTIITLWVFALFFHLVPGFNNLQVLNKVTASNDSLPFSMYLNIDKPMIIFTLILAYPPLLGKIKTVKVKPIIFTLLPLFALLPIASFLGALKLELSLPSWWWLFAFNNLILVCVAEEALFRGFFQQLISEKCGWVVGLMLASILFGLAHFAGGTLLMIFATLAGIGYGLIFHFTGRLWAAILCHFAFNFAHLAFFTYPMLAK
ncbi:CPBP family intramembrane glutamic endopeptidase [uncultured Shewanella sp.]|uniref:CPBP family intramembrane glutamic endopeptidase n=1 Tax=uncultured Shewanella sp. TaxID=173975 RepID=UPI00263631D9|nr:CPBP family intramembrane glutamic endopeptidase [uncultured Shewanella sp.]